MSESSTFEFKADWPNSNDHLKVAAIVGHTTPTSSRLWFRAGKPGKYYILYFDGGNESSCEWFEQHKVLSWDEDTVVAAKEKGIFVKDAGQVDNWDSDTIFVVDIALLQETTFYHYALYSIDDKRIILGHNRDYGFRTPSSEPGKFSFGLYSCHMPYKFCKLTKKTTVLDGINIWKDFYNTLRDNASSNNMDFVIAGGDQVYVDGVKSLNIWEHLNQVMRKEGGEVLPDVEIMKSWYRKIYRGYWGFDHVRRVFSSFPTYMTWDDHELLNGWGSRYLNNSNHKDELYRILPDFAKKGLNEAEGRQLVERMGKAGSDVYKEYEHSHNPDTAEGQYDYSFTHKKCAFYTLDSRGHRNINQRKILGEDQMGRFKKYVDGLSDNTKFLFVVSAVPVQHRLDCVVNMSEKFVPNKLVYDLRDAWTWKGWNKEGEASELKIFMEILFAAAKRGIKVCILSGDVHVSAAFHFTDKEGNKIYELTSSAITHKFPVPYDSLYPIVAKRIVAKAGTIAGKYDFKLGAFYPESSYALVKVNPEEDKVVFQIYGKNGTEVESELTW